MMTRDKYGIAFQEGFERTIAFLIARGANRDEAREVAQEAWVKGWERIAQLRDERSITEWVNAIALNLLRSSLRQRRLMELSQMKHEPEAAPSINLAAIDMTQALQKCKPRQRQFLEAFLDGYSGNELATQTGRSLGAIHAEMCRARQALREHMQGDPLSGST
jgi:RNA polymerase sigma-70 factor, ECF subfamily